MLSLFPDLFDWSFYVPFFFRVFLGLYILGVGYSFFRRSAASTEKSEDKLSWGILGGLLIVLASCLFVGVVVQVAGAVAFALCLFAIYAKKYNVKEIDESTTFYLLFALLSISLVFLGPGPFAFDLPL